MDLKFSIYTQKKEAGLGNSLLSPSNLKLQQSVTYMLWNQENSTPKIETKKVLVFI